MVLKFSAHGSVFTVLEFNGSLSMVRVRGSVNHNRTCGSKRKKIMNFSTEELQVGWIW